MHFLLKTAAPAAVLAAVLAPEYTAASPADSYVYEHEYVIVRDSSEDAAPLARRAANRSTVKLVNFPPRRALSAGRRKVLRDQTFDDCPAIQAADSGIRLCHPNRVLRIAAVPNDERLPEMWGLVNTTGGPDIAATGAWNVSTGDRARGIVAVLDTGVDYRHPDLAPNVWVNPYEIPGNGVDDDQNGWADDVHGINSVTGSGDPVDDNGHGTHVAGIIAAAGNNGRGVTGVNWHAQVIAVKFMNRFGEGDLYSELLAMHYIADLKERRGIQIVALNASYGSPIFDEAEYEAAARLRELGILVVAAAGNSGSDNDVLRNYPAGFPLDNIITVAAVNINGALASYSNYGHRTVNIAAPGDNILGLVPGGGYSYQSGTSMAAPHVSGAAALLKSAHPGFSMSAIRSAILTYGTPYPTLTGLVSSGRILNLAGMLGVAAESPPEFTPPNQPHAAELFDIAVGGDSSTLSKSVDNRSYVYLALAQNPASVEKTAIAEVRLTLNGRPCESAAFFRVHSGEYLLLRAKFKDLKRTMPVQFHVLNADAVVTQSETISLRDRSNRGTPNYQKVCKAFLKALRKAN